MKSFLETLAEAATRAYEENLISDHSVVGVLTPDDFDKYVGEYGFEVISDGCDEYFVMSGGCGIELRYYKDQRWIPMEDSKITFGYQRHNSKEEQKQQFKKFVEGL